MEASRYVLGKGFNPEEFLKDIKAAKEAVGEAGEADARHLEMLVNTATALAVSGHILIFFGVAYPFGVLPGLVCLFGAVGISTARCMRWTIIGHHVSHGGYDKFQKGHPDRLPRHYKRGIFATGFRRFIDWLDWMLPGAWDVEHNKLHHYYLSEDKDPDLVERNFELLHKLPLPMFAKYASMIFWMFTWKATYYSPNTFKELELSRGTTMASRFWPASRDRMDPMTVADLFFMAPLTSLAKGEFFGALFWPVFAAQWLLVVAPFVVIVVSPALVPSALGYLGAWPFELEWQRAAWKALLFGLTADMLSNAHSFIIIACNHSGGDLYRYSTSCKAYSAEWFLRCAYSSANFETGNDLVDGLYGWLNYQVEHHMFPDMTPLQYRKLQPLVKSVCNKHGVLYVQQNGLYRLWKMLRVAVGDDHMQQCKAIIDPTVERKGGDAVAVPDAFIGS